MSATVDALFARYEGLAIGEKKQAVGDEAAYITARTLNVDGGNWMS